MKTKSDPGIDSYLGYSFTINDYPLESPDNIGYPVFDLNKYKKDYPDYYSNIPIKKSYSNFVSFYTFDRYEVKKKDNHKVKGGANLNCPIFKIGAQAAYKTVWQMSELNINEHVYVEYTNSYHDRKYAVLLPTKIGDYLDYLSDGFKRYVYYSDLVNLIKNYGCFVISQYYTGAQASIFYKGDYIEHSTTKAIEIEQEFEETISGTINTVGFDANGGFTINDSNSTSSSDKFASIEIAARTIGGISPFISFSSPRDINSVNYDLTSWCNSLSDQANLTIAGFPDNSLIPITDFIEEDNLKREIRNYYEHNISPLNELCEPYLAVQMEFINDNYVSVDLALYTRYSETIKYHILKEEVPFSELSIYIKRLKNTFPYLKIVGEDSVLVDLPENDPDLHFEIIDWGGIIWTVLFHGDDDIAYLREAYVNSEQITDYCEEEVARLNKLYPEIRAIEKINYFLYDFGDIDCDNVSLTWDFPVIFYNEEDYSEIHEINTAIFKDAKKFIDNETGKTYILTTGYSSSDEEKQFGKMAFTLYSEEIIDDYNFEEIINKMPLANNMTLKKIRKDYKLIAL